eukprot:CAMPEP_0182426400 /NCGR_PEP_ID=MMETSP1167-20130531/12883_1 /TAXON_ID=2988 /ORGANISM="Mallomonas Sp, Strain CCMP3275" /LENGTH=367 /DNA_ID=CAMNT_0024607787 /DNA_START=105 /DNA_END=1208 /DNA_ORIENTATION=+
MLAISPNNNEIHIYGDCILSGGMNWRKLHVLQEHDLLVSSIDWSPITNKIVSCSHDRNAFVWTFDSSTSVWKPALVILRIDRAALDVSWSLDGLRFAVASGSKCVPVCSYEEKNDWWVSKMVKKKFKSSVLCLSFHPCNGQVLAAGAADFKLRVYSTYDSEVDVMGPVSKPFLTALEFGEVYCELSCQCWVNALAWSPTGSSLCFSGQDSSIHFVHFSSSSSTPVVQTLSLSTLPLTSLLYLSETSTVAGGHDCVPLLFGKTQGEWSLMTGVTGGLDEGVGRGKEEMDGSTSASVASARALFQNKSVRGQASSEDSLNTQHEKPIIGLRAYSLKPLRFSSTALDGRLVVWDIAQIQPAHMAMSALSI